mmetsp:Transcript_4817/g.7227  ORF Transcript_4817/g.7227 Transcript_4817/m.7227 type:complete len:334 (-) Transcript_4817:40-1041(-)
MCDRTSEFRALARGLEGAVPSTPEKPKVPPVSTLSDFHVTASSISKEIYFTSQKLKKLTRLVQRRSLFDDPAAEINGLVHSIKGDITQLNAKLEQAQGYVDARKQKMGERNQQASHSVAVVGTLKQQLMQATRAFKDVLQKRSESMRAQQGRRDLYGQQRAPAVTLGKPIVYKPITAAAPDRSRAGPDASRRTADPNRSPSLPRPAGVTDVPLDEDVSTALGTPQAPSTPLLQQNLLIPDQTYLESRTTAMTDVESHIVELGTIFNKLALMLQDQREMVERLDDNIEDAHENINRSELMLMNVWNNLSSNRALAMKLFAVLVIFVTLFLLFLA